MARRGSSMFVPSGAGGAPGAKPMAGGMGLVDFDSEDESEEEQTPKPAPPPAQPAGAPASGGAGHRPLVGGFAAAAYEAARADHYARQQALKAKKAGAPPPGGQRRPHPSHK